MPTMYPYAPPSVSGGNWSVPVWLQNPARVQRTLEALAYQRFIADVIFAQGPPATGGAVAFDQITLNDLFLARDVQEIEPGSEFPQLTDVDQVPLVALIKKWGGEVPITDEARDRDRRDVVQRAMNRLINTIVRKVDTVALAALDAAPINTLVGSGDWSTAATDIIKDLGTAANIVDALDMGYMVDTVLINPAQELDLIVDKDIRDAMPRETQNNTLQTRRIGTVMGFDFWASNRVTAGTAYALQRKVAGSISDEVPLYARPIRDERREVTYVHGARRVVPYVTDPKTVVKITGI
jgi:hypothetical protein